METLSRDFMLEQILLFVCEYFHNARTILEETWKEKEMKISEEERKTNERWKKKANEKEITAKRNK